MQTKVKRPPMYKIIIQNNPWTKEQETEWMQNQYCNLNGVFTLDVAESKVEYIKAHLKGLNLYIEKTS